MNAALVVISRGPRGWNPGAPSVHRLLLRVLLVRQLQGADEHSPFLLARVRRARALVRLVLPARFALEKDRRAGGRLLRGGAVALARLLAAAAALGARVDLHHRRVDLARDLVAARTTVLVDQVLRVDEGLALLAPAGLDDLRVVFGRRRLLVLGLLRVLLLVLRLLPVSGERQRHNGDQGRDDPHGFL